MKWILLVAVLPLFVSCSSSETKKEASVLGIDNEDKVNIVSLRNEARRLLRKAVCANCHIPPGNPAALKIYDLDKENWHESLSNRQLLQFKWRLPVDYERFIEQKGDPKTQLLDSREIKFLKDYVDLEVNHREKKIIDL